jgi:hypothetical protein
MKKSPHLAAGALLVLALVTFGCSANERRSDSGSSDGRVYNPQTRDYEWTNTQRTPTSAGADRTRRSSNF